jgi:DNA-binding MarR family transcriptional regulator
VSAVRSSPDEATPVTGASRQQQSPRSRLAYEPADRPTGRVLNRYTQVELLLALREREPARIGELATRLKLAPNTISGLVQQLVETHGRGPNPTDRRVAAVTLTPAGLAKLDEWELAHHRRLSADPARARHRRPGRRPVRAARARPPSRKARQPGAQLTTPVSGSMNEPVGAGFEPLTRRRPPETTSLDP